MHITSSWARAYGLPDPALDGDALLGCDSWQVQRIALYYRNVATAADDFADHMLRANSSLYAGWSTPTAHSTIYMVMTAATTLSAHQRACAAATEEFATALTAAHSDVTHAYAVANHTINAMNLRREAPPLDPDYGLALEAERTGVVMLLASATSAARRRYDHAATRLVTTLPRDPRELLPPHVVDCLDHRATRRAHDVDAANRAALVRDQHASSRQRRSVANSIDQALAHAEESGQVVQLLTYHSDDPDGQGGVSIAIGDVASADNVSVLVPGVGNSPSAMTGTLDLATGFNQATTEAGFTGATGATVVWFDYDIPLSWTHDSPPGSAQRLVTGALSDSALALDASGAEHAGSRLEHFTGDLRAMMDSTAALTLIGHSYGSTVVSQAARTSGAQAGIDDIVLLGSPGVGYRVDDATDYTAITAEHLYTLAFPADPVTQPLTDTLASAINPLGAQLRQWGLGHDSGPFGTDPDDAAFGAQSIAVSSNVPLTGSKNFGLSVLTELSQHRFSLGEAAPLKNTEQHALDNYLSGEALSAVAAVSAGRYSQVPLRPQE